MPATSLDETFKSWGEWCHFFLDKVEITMSPKLYHSNNVLRANEGRKAI